MLLAAAYTKSSPSVFVIAWRALINNQARNLPGVIMEMQPGEMETDAIILLLPATERGFLKRVSFFHLSKMVSSLRLHINTTNTLSQSKSRSLCARVTACCEWKKGECR
jgi:hypothetical protein